MIVGFSFRDDKFHRFMNIIDYDLDAVPRKGDYVELPGGPLIADPTWYADQAVVATVRWILEDGPDVVVCCDIYWENDEQMRPGEPGSGWRDYLYSDDPDKVADVPTEQEI